MQNSTGCLFGFALLAGALLATPAQAALVDWQSSVLNSSPSSTHFDPVSGLAPAVVDVGALSGDRSFEFIVNAGVGGVSSAMLGSYTLNGNQGLKFEQWPDQLVVGITAFGVADYSSTVILPLFTDTHVAFVSDGFSGTDVYVGGTYSYSFPNVSLAASGPQGLAGIYRPVDGTFFDVLDGSIVGFASFDIALTPQQISDHATAFAVPEPTTFALLGLASGVLLRRRREP